MSTKGMFRCLAALGGILLLAAPAASQMTLTEVGREASGEERLASLIERLEVGMSALEELERRDALEILHRIANELRAEQRGEQDESDEVKTVRRRLKVMRLAVDAYLEAGKREAAERVELAMHARELAIEGVRGEKANRVREQAPNRGQLAELLGGAAGLYKEWEMPDRAQALAELSKVYAQQWKRRQQAGREGRTTEREGGREREGDDGLDSLARRIEIIRYARDAFAETGDERNTKVLNGVVLYGELALEGVTGERLDKAAAAVPGKRNLVEYMGWAARKYNEWGNRERAAACRRLAGYYMGQLESQEGEGEEERRVERERDVRRERDVDRRRDAEGNIEDLNRRIEILRFARAAHAEAEHPDARDILERTIHLAELQRSDAGPERIAQASEGLPMELIVELVRGASKLYREWGNEERASACSSLAEFYGQRARANEEGGREEAGRERAIGDELHARLRELLRRTDELQEELREIRATINHLIER